MILLVFFFPLALYLLLLGVINRRRRPLLVRGVWDGIGLLFAASGFLLFAGPTVFSSFSEHWRMLWLLGQRDAKIAGPDGAWQFWIFLSILYFSLIVGGAALLLWRQRHLTSIYNVEAAQVEQAVTGVCEGLGLNPVRSGSMFLFGVSLGQSPRRRGPNAEKIQAPHYLSAAVHATGDEHLETLAKLASGALAPDGTVLEQTAVLELDSFPLMYHVTLRWDPADSTLRQAVEAELAHRLSETRTRDSALGGWLLTLGVLLLMFEFLGTFVVILLQLVHR